MLKKEKDPSFILYRVASGPICVVVALWTLAIGKSVVILEAIRCAAKYFTTTAGEAAVMDSFLPLEPGSERIFF